MLCRDQFDFRQQLGRILSGLRRDRHRKHADRNRLIEKVQPLLMEDDRYLVQSGLDFWFTPEGIKPKFPKRWKQSVLTWSAIYPLVLSISLLVEFLRRYLGVADHHYLQLLLITGIVVWLMVYVVMPRYTKLVHRWLHR